MKFPSNCPKCKVSFDNWPGPNTGYMFQRAEPDLDKSSINKDRVMDEIMECSKCHTLFRFRWKLESMHMLRERKLK